MRSQITVILEDQTRFLVLRLRIDILCNTCIDSAKVHSDTIESYMRSLDMSQDLEILRNAISDHNLEILVHSFSSCGFETDQYTLLLKWLKRQMMNIEQNLVTISRWQWFVKYKTGRGCILNLSHVIYADHVAEIESVVFGILDENFCWDWARVFNFNLIVLVGVDFD